MTEPADTDRDGSTLIIAQWVAHHLGALAVFGEHGETSPPGDAVDTRRPFILKRGYERLVRDHSVLVVDDVMQHRLLNPRDHRCLPPQRRFGTGGGGGL